MNFLPGNRLKLYRNFKALETNDFHGMVRYYEQFEDGIRSLDFEEYFDCSLVYTEALFQTGDHGKHVVMCDHLLETVIMHNIEYWGGEDLYAHLLFKKAASLYHLHEFPKAEHILRELVKINPWQRLPIRFLKTCLIRQRPSWLQKTRAATVVLVLATALVIALEIFVIKPFFSEWYSFSLIFHNVLFGSGIAVLTGGESVHIIKCTREAEAFGCRMRRRKDRRGER
jgi:hypothetical protein